jgi:hypothetical protein
LAARPGRGVCGRPRKFLQGLADELIAWAEFEFRCSRTRSDGATEADHGAVRRRIEAKLGGKGRAPAPEEPAFPDDLDYLWLWFCEIADGVAENGMAPAGVSWVDLSAWCRVTGELLEPWEARLLVRLGALRAAILAEKIQTKPPRQD